MADQEDVQLFTALSYACARLNFTLRTIEHEADCFIDNLDFGRPF